jgi:hypothetical protein
MQKQTANRNHHNHEQNADENFHAEVQMALISFGLLARMVQRDKPPRKIQRVSQNPQMTPARSSGAMTNPANSLALPCQ